MVDSQKYPPYDYKLCPLDDPAEDLRVIKITLHCDSHDDKVEAQIVQFDEEQEYAALSWCWGSYNATEKATMRITHNDQPYDFQISLALNSALKQLRKYKVEYIWIDQVSINQGDVSERNNQVRMMAKIYTRAELVYVWLGEEKEVDSEDTGAAFRFMKTKVLQLEHFDHLVKDRMLHKDWNNMVELLKRPWFSRRWVVQEIALARDAVILCGPYRIKWVDFADAVSLFNDAEAEKHTVSRAIMMGKKEYGFKPRYFGHVPALSATRLVQVTNDLFRRRADHEKVALLSLEQLVSTFTAFNASDPKDTIYAVLAIAKDTMPRTSHADMKLMMRSYKREIQDKFIEQLSQKIVAKSYYVNYEQAVSDVFVDFVDFAISQSERTRALDIICRPWAPWPGSEDLFGDSNVPTRAVFPEAVSQRKDALGQDSIPSWIRSINGAAYGLEPKSKRMVRKNPDTLVGLPPQRNYTAAGTLPVTKLLRFEQGITKHSQYPELNGVHYHSMFVEGFVVDKVDNLRTASQMGNIPKDWAQVGRKSAHKSDQWEQLPDDYWRTLVADQGKNGNPPRHYPRLINHALESHVQGDTFSTQEAIDHPECQAVSEVLERVQSVIWNRRLVSTKEKRLGLVPEYAEKGDVIVILYGCSVPVILRKFVKTNKEVEEEGKSKLTRQQKMAARKIIESFRKFVAKRNQERSEGKLPTPHSTPRQNPLGGPLYGDKNNAQGVQKLDFGGGAMHAEPLSEHDVGLALVMEENTHRREEFTASGTNVEEKGSNSRYKIPGAFVTTPDDSPCISRKGTDIVAPGPTFPRTVVELTRTLTDNNPNPNVEPPIKADEHTFYQLIGECYLHGMMNGEAIPMQRSAEDDAKQRTAQEKENLAAMRRAAEDAKNLPPGEDIRSIHRSLTEPIVKSSVSPPPHALVESPLFMRTVFELR
ncbi:HET-domain-containing protein [Tothia fuscella]|uniref:HET-domain-containing protein n=1 Tax=Tothia fuscella TaxID=1048955 RepID=A0A9P4TX42_9PEZI|nr:HET-domain-containing protein [Tothia fuscella]